MAKIRIITSSAGKKKYQVTSGSGSGRNRKTFHTLKDAKYYRHEINEREKQRKRKIQLGFAPVSINLKDCMNGYLTSVNGDIKKTSFTRYTQYLQHFLSFLTEKFPQVIYPEEVAVRHLEAFKSYRLAIPRAAKTVKSELECLSSLFKWCIKNEYALKNPAALVSKPRTDKKKPHIFTPAELELIFSNAGKKELFYRTLYYTGFRLNEVLSIQVQDIDLPNHRIIYHNLKARRDEYCLLAKKLEALLKKEIKGKAPEDFIFNFPLQGNSRTNKLRNEFYALLDTLDIPRRNLHNFKHTYVTHLLDKTKNPLLVQKLAHHKDLKTTLGYYSGVSEEAERAALDSFPV